MKLLYTFFALALCFSFQLAQGQTYNVNTAANPAVGGVCPANTGIDNTYDCAFDNQPAINLGSFTDTNPAGSVLQTLTLVVYGACSGTLEFFLNGTSVVTGTASGLSCSCQSISGDPNIPQTYVATITPAMAAAFVAGGSNTITAAASNSTSGAQCIYGYDAVLTVGPGTPTTVPTMGQWGLIILGLLVASAGAVTLWKRKFSPSAQAA